MEHPNTLNWVMRQPMEIEGRSGNRRSELMELAQRELDISDTDLEAFDPTFFRVQASNQKLDAYFTRMTDTTLANFAADAKMGVSLQQSHNGNRDLGLGRSLDAEVKGRSGSQVVEIDFYTIPGLQSGSVSSDNLIRGIKSGIYRDVSVGFTPGKFECSICGGDPMNDIWRYFSGEIDYDECCFHYPGNSYETKKGKREVATAWIHDGRLNEVSFVYDGATPGASILAIEKARMAKEMKLLPVDVENMLEKRYRTPIIGAPRQFQGESLVGQRRDAGSATETGLPAGEENTVEDVVLNVAEDTTANPEGVVEVSEENPETVLNPVDENTAVVVDTETEGRDAGRWMEFRSKHVGEGKLLRSVGNDPIVVASVLADALVQEQARSKANAALVDYGTKYQERLKKDAHEAGARAFGTAYNRDHYDRIFSRMDADEMVVQIEQFDAIGNERFPGGRKTHDSADNSVDADGEVRTTSKRHIV